MPDNVEDCNCGRDSSRRHCPNCGHINYYAIKTIAKRPHPQTGVMVEAFTFRCRTCNRHFDELQWQFECKAPRSVRAQQKELREITKETILRRAESGAKFDENDRRHFQKYVRIPYKEYMDAFNKNQRVKERLLEEKAKRLTAVAPPVIKDSKLTPLQYHIENCNYCNTHNENCEVAKQLEVAEKMVQP